jgi:cysteine desulfuration protein SufE
LAKNHKCSENIREDKYLIKGCSTKLWLKPVFVNNNLHFEVDAEIGLLSLGLGILATMLYNGRTCQEMAQVDQNVFIEIGFIERAKCDQKQRLCEHFETNRFVYKILQ